MGRTSKHGKTKDADAKHRLQRVHADLLLHCKTKACVLKTLTVLNAEGVLAAGVVADDASLTKQRGRHCIRQSAKKAANIETPYDVSCIVFREESEYDTPGAQF